MKTFRLSILTPEGIAFEGDCLRLYAVGSKGMIGILPGHMDYLTLINATPITIWEPKKEARVLHTMGGVLLFEDNKCTITVEYLLED